MNIRTILVPIDFSASSMDVTHQAASLAARLGARLVVLHVVELPAGVSPDTRVRPEGVDRTASDYLCQDAHQRLAPFADAAREHGIEAEARARLGPVVTTILRASHELAADLIVIGTRGRTGLARLVMGSVAEGVARHSHVPVLLVRREAHPDCARADCAWCTPDGRSPAEEIIAGEADG